MDASLYGDDLPCSFMNGRNLSLITLGMIAGVFFGVFVPKRMRRVTATISRDRTNGRNVSLITLAMIARVLRRIRAEKDASRYGDDVSANACPRADKTARRPNGSCRRRSSSPALVMNGQTLSLITLAMIAGVFFDRIARACRRFFSTFRSRSH